MNKKQKRIIIFGLILVAGIPVAIWAVLHFAYHRTVSIDGLIDYVGSVISSIAAMAVAFIGVNENKKYYELKTEDESKKYAKLIKPNLMLFIQNNETEIYIYLRNCSDNPAFGIIVIFEQEKLSFDKVLKNECNRIDIPFEDYNNLPKNIDVIYKDSNNNVLVDVHRLCNNGENFIYDLINSEYEILNY